MDDRRRFERINLPEASKVYATDADGKRLGLVRILGRGGLLVATGEKFEDGSEYTLALVDESEGIRRKVHAEALYTTPQGVGFKFVNLEPDAAVEVGVIIGKYYSAAGTGG
jgi:hypothetical protein